MIFYDIWYDVIKAWLRIQFSIPRRPHKFEKNIPITKYITWSNFGRYFEKKLWPSHIIWNLMFKSAPSELISSQRALTFDNGKEFDHISWHKFAARLRFSGKGFIGVIWFSLFLTLSLFFFNHFRIIYQMLLTSTVILCQCC